MALRANRPQSFLQDENAQANLPSGKGAHHESKGLQQQQQGPVERKKLSNITNHVLLQPKLTSKAVADKERFAVRADLQESSTLPTAKKTHRPPLKNISNGTPNPTNNSSSRPPLKSKAELKPQTQDSTPSAFQLPPSSRLNLTEEMRKKAALWAQEGIERVHFTGDDMEKQRCLMRDEEISKRVAMIQNCRIDIPFPKFSTPRMLKPGSTWEPVGEVLKPDMVDNLSDDDAILKDEGLTTKMVEELLGQIDYYAIRSPPRFTEGWPKVKDYEEI